MSLCTTCKIGLMQSGTTTVTFDKESMVIVFREVPAQVCNNCGDYTIESSVAKSLLQKAKEERTKGHEISVLNYKKAA